MKDKVVNSVEHHFLLLHRFNSSRGSVFKNKAEVMFTASKDKYSILGFFDDSFAINESFIFLLEFPQKDCAFYFSQDVNPMKAAHDQNVNMKNLGLSCQANVRFTGFTRFQNQEVAYIDGCTSSESVHWYYPIGQYQKWGGSIPSLTNQGINEILLWVEISDYLLLSRFNHLTLTCVSKKIMISPIILVINCFVSEN